jgi:hypothetical protein
MIGNSKTWQRGCSKWSVNLHLEKR